MAAAAPLRPRELDGVAPGLGVIIDRATPQQQPPPLLEFVGRTLKAGEAGVFLAMLALQTEAGRLGGPVQNRLAIERMRQACDIVRMVKDFLVPKLLANPTRRAHLRVLDACARGLRVEATAAGGTFRDGANAFAGLLQAFLEQADAHPQYGDYDDLEEAAREIRRRGERLLQTSYTVRTQAAPAPGGVAEAGQLGVDHHAAAAQGAEADED